MTNPINTAAAARTSRRGWLRRGAALAFYAFGILAISGPILHVLATSSGPNGPNTGANDAGTGNIAWTNPGNVRFSEDGRATVSLTSADTSNYVKATSPGFSIPSGAVIDGIQVDVERSEGNTNSNNSIRDNAVRIVKGGTIGSTDRSNTGVNWPTTDTYFTYGGSTDTWGDTWTASDINNANFGFALSALDVKAGGPPSGTEQARIDHIRTTIYYTLNPAFDQSAYRFFANADSADVGSALAAQDTAATAPSKGTPFRLRMALHVSNTALTQNGQNFKLQFAKKGSGTCASPEFSYADVNGSTAIRYNDNATPADGAALTDNANDPVHSGHTNDNQTYEEANNFTNSQSAVASGEDGLWDFSLVDAAGDYGTAYCFKAVTSTGSNLGGYTVYPQVTTAAAPTLNQSAYRFFANANGTDVGSALVAQDTAATLTSAGQAFRLRTAVHAAGNNLFQSGKNFKLRYADKGTGSCASPENPYEDVGGTASSSGPNYAGTAVDDASVGSVTWSNPSQGTADDGSLASASTAGASTTHYLKATNFGFSIPTNATITGIKAEIKKDNTSASGSAFDNAVRIVKGGVIGSTDRSDPNPVPNGSLAYVTYGGTSDVWGETWTASDINASDFGIANSITGPGLANTTNIDAIRITVYYTTGVIAFKDNATPADGAALTDNANDPVHSGHTNNNQTYEEANNFTNSQSSIPAGEDGLWDFSLIDNGAPAGTTYCFRITDSGGTALDMYDQYPVITTFTSGGGGPSTSADIVDAGGTPVTAPVYPLSAETVGFGCQTSTGTFSTSTQRVRVSNGSTAEDWNLSLAASDPTDSWTSGYDFNDPGGSGCSDGGDSDSLGGGADRESDRRHGHARHRLLDHGYQRGIERRVRRRYERLNRHYVGHDRLRHELFLGLYRPRPLPKHSRRFAVGFLFAAHDADSDCDLNRVGWLRPGSARCDALGM